MRLPALYRVSGYHSNAQWEMYVKANSPMDAFEHATSKNPWDILMGVHISIEANFFDIIEHETLAASVVKDHQEQTE